MTLSLKVSEIFHSFQGEGPDIGVPSVFLRLAGCPVGCSFCDSKYAWGRKPTEHSEASPGGIAKEIDRYPILSHLVVTGGEPLVQQEGLTEVLLGLRPYRHVSVETSGVIPVTVSNLRYLVHRWVVSPKLGNAGSKAALSLSLEALRDFATMNHSVFKFVAGDLPDLEEADKLVRTLGLAPFRVYIMPEGVDTDRVLQVSRVLAPVVLDLGWNLTTRLHILLWGNERGR